MIAENILETNGELVPRVFTALPNSGNGTRFRPFQIVSLLDMVEFPLTQFVDLYVRLTLILKRLSQHKPLSQDETEGLLTWVATIQNVGEFCEIDLSYFCNRIVQKVQSPSQTTVKLSVLLSQLRAGWDNELRKRMFMFIPLADSTFMNKDEIFGTEVAERISEANADIKAAGNCFGTGNYTASVFHLMRVAELGLRRVGKKLKVKLIHNKKPISIEYAVWEQVITACKNKIDKIRQTHVGAKREQDLILFSDAAQHCLFMKDIWRNNVSHTRNAYNQPEALAVMARVKDFMRFLAVNDI